MFLSIWLIVLLIFHVLKRIEIRIAATIVKMLTFIHLIYLLQALFLSVLMSNHTIRFTHLHALKILIIDSLEASLS